MSAPQMMLVPGTPLRIASPFLGRRVTPKNWGWNRGWRREAHWGLTLSSSAGIFQACTQSPRQLEGPRCLFVHVRWLSSEAGTHPSALVGPHPSVLPWGPT